jgi:ferredoxin
MADYACASCAGPVAEGRCPTCRASRQLLRDQSPHLDRALLIQLLAALVVILTALAIVVEHAG